MDLRDSGLATLGSDHINPNKPSIALKIWRTQTIPEHDTYPGDCQGPKIWDDKGFGQTLRPLLGQFCCTVGRWAEEHEQGSPETSPARGSLLFWMGCGSPNVCTLPSAHPSGYRSLARL